MPAAHTLDSRFLPVKPECEVDVVDGEDAARELGSKARYYMVRIIPALSVDR